MAETASSVPPFIPGLLIVGLLIIISVIIGWRNYVRRGERRVMPGMSDWMFWDEAGGEGGGRPERPKLWEVYVSAKRDHEKNGDEWDRIMPLCATSLAAEPPHLKNSSDPELSRAHTTNSPALNTRMNRLNFLSSSPPRPTSPLTPPHRLQVSVLISMPSAHRPRCQQLQDADVKSEKSPECFAELPSLTDTRRQSVSSSIWKENLPPDTDEAEAEGSPEVALGVTVLPWRKGEDADESVERTDVSTP